MSSLVTWSTRLIFDCFREFHRRRSARSRCWRSWRTRTSCHCRQWSCRRIASTSSSNSSPWTSRSTSINSLPASTSIRGRSRAISSRFEDFSHFDRLKSHGPHTRVFASTSPRAYVSKNESFRLEAPLLVFSECSLRMIKFSQVDYIIFSMNDVLK